MGLLRYIMIKTKCRKCKIRESRT